MDDFKFPLAILVPSSHLYRGMHLNAISATTVQPDVTDILLLFNDGSETIAKLVRGTDDQLFLSVDAYKTTRGTSILSKAWIVKDIVGHDKELDIHLGNHMPDDKDV